MKKENNMYYLNDFHKVYILQNIVDYLIEKKSKKYESDFKKMESLRNKITILFEEEIKKAIPKEHLQVFKKYDLIYKDDALFIIWLSINLLDSIITINGVNYCPQHKHDILKNNTRSNIFSVPTTIILPIFVKNIITTEEKLVKISSKNISVSEKIVKQESIKILNNVPDLRKKILEIINIEKEFYMDIKNIRNEYEKRLNSKRTLETLFRSFPKIKDMVSEETVNDIKSFQNTTSQKEIDNNNSYTELEKNLEIYEEEILSDS